MYGIMFLAPITNGIKGKKKRAFQLLVFCLGTILTDALYINVLFFCVEAVGIFNGFSVDINAYIIEVSTPNTFEMTMGLHGPIIAGFIFLNEDDVQDIVVHKQIQSIIHGCFRQCRDFSHQFLIDIIDGRVA